jgi:hypothetical protein
VQYNHRVACQFSMREIEGIEEAIEKLKPLMPRLIAQFDLENERFKKLFAIEHDHIGRVLKSHLIVENYLTRYLIAKFELETLDDAKLTFFQKAQLIPSSGEASTFVRPGIIALNKVRNKLSHNIDAIIEFGDIESIMSVLEISRSGVRFDNPYSAIEAFCAVACAFLIVDPPELQFAIVKAFKSIRLLGPNPPTQTTE